MVGHWYEHLLHNQSALRLKGRLLFTPGVMVTSVPYQLESSEAREEAGAASAQDWNAPGSVRRGPVDRAAEGAGRASKALRPHGSPW